MITIFHNPRCSKSREGLELVKQNAQEFQLRDYTKDLLTEKELKELLTLLGMAPIELVRTNEKIWKENYKNKDLSDPELIRVMVQHPSLIQRPIVVKDKKAVVGRPAENIAELLK